MEPRVLGNKQRERGTGEAALQHLSSRALARQGPFGSLSQEPSHEASTARRSGTGNDRKPLLSLRQHSTASLQLQWETRPGPMGSMRTRQEQRHFASKGDRPDDITGEWETGLGSIRRPLLTSIRSQQGPRQSFCGAGTDASGLSSLKGKN